MLNLHRPPIEHDRVLVHPTGASSYPVIAAGGYTEELGQLLESLKATKTFIISQEGLEDMVIRPFLEFYPVDESHIIKIGQGEKFKHIRSLGAVYNTLIEKGVDRKSVILALGGGVVGDFAGFVAATILRGIRFVQLPTTLLSAVDSSVGGKTAVNADLGKNMIGAFHHPEFVFFNMNTLTTLPDREWDCGLAEMAKHGFMDAPSREILLASAEKMRDPHSEELRYAVLASVAFKAGVVSEDEKEKGLRSILNLGHTTAHAIESLTHYEKYTHGESVARGLVTMLFLSREKLGLGSDEIESMVSLLEKLRLPLATEGLSGENLYEHAAFDKKNKGGEILFVLLKSMGEPIFGQPVERELFLKAWSEQRSRFG